MSCLVIELAVVHNTRSAMINKVAARLIPSYLSKPIAQGNESFLLYWHKCFAYSKLTVDMCMNGYFYFAMISRSIQLANLCAHE